MLYASYRLLSEVFPVDAEATRDTRGDIAEKVVLEDNLFNLLTDSEGTRSSALEHFELWDDRNPVQTHALR